MADEAEKRLLARARLETLRNNSPHSWYEREVEEFHDIVTELEEARRAPGAAHPRSNIQTSCDAIGHLFNGG